ncbi:10113_t:CDS:2 [Ambispora gerdemannii]|uniref:10113_t:CDS:1 n=1 Tax=Ambispora gerdemannii TaxID=144530 RepID=A0A9N8VKQ7_9GLOM|nr:10113_t:CDS:2 [Ambispora gerdemannii]
MTHSFTKSQKMLSEFSKNVNSLFRQRKSNLFVPLSLATNTTLITVILKSSDLMSPFQKYEKVKRPTLLVTKSDTSNVNKNDGINRINKNTKLEMIICIVSTNEDDYKKAIITEIKDGENYSNDNRILIDGNDESGNIKDIINGQDTNNVNDHDGNYKKAIVIEIKDEVLVIDRNNEEDMTNRQNTSDYKKAIVAEIKDGESDNYDNITLVIDRNDEFGNIEDTEEDTSNVNDNDGDYKKAIITEIKDCERINNDNMTLVPSHHLKSLYYY